MSQKDIGIIGISFKNGHHKRHISESSMLSYFSINVLCISNKGRNEENSQRMNVLLSSFSALPLIPALDYVARVLLGDGEFSAYRKCS